MATKNHLELHERSEHNGDHRGDGLPHFDIDTPQQNGYHMANWIPHGEPDDTHQTGYRSSDSGRPCSSWTEDAQDIPIVVVVTPQDLQRNNHNHNSNSNGNSVRVLVDGGGSTGLTEDCKHVKEQQGNCSSADETQDEDLVKYLSNKRQSHRKKGQSSKSESRDLSSQTAEEKIINGIKLQKELIDTIRFQPWNIHKKLKLLRKAKAYVKGHESSLSRGQDFQQMGFDAFRRIRRELVNTISIFIPWEMQIKRVEGHFGSVVASYFLFLRWLLWVNTILTLLTVSFIILPQVIAGEKQAVPVNEVAKSGDLDTLLAAEGIAKYSVLFYGFYQNTATSSGYEIPVAYLLTGLAIYLLSIIIVLSKMAANARLNKTATKDEMFSFSWKLFSSWDYMVGNPDTANNKYAAIITTFKESIREVEEKAKVEKKKLLIFLRCLGIAFSLLLYGLSGYLTYYTVTTSENNPDVEKSYFEANSTTWVITVIFLVFPNFFDLISKMEQYHPRTNLRAQLARVFILNFLNLASLLYSLYQKILLSTDCRPKSHSASSFKDGTTAAISRNISTLPNQNCTKTQGLKCWENYVGQEVIKLTELDLAMTIILILIQDFLRGLWVRFCNQCWCWNLEKTFPEYPEFKTAENILHLINNQGMIWLGWFFSPGLCLMNLLKLVILAYIRFWSVLVCNVPEKRIFRASRSNNFYYVLLLLMLLICCIPPMLVVFNSHSHDCGPFSNQENVMDVLEKQSVVFAFVMKYAKNPATSFILLGALSMVIYYLWSISRSLKENNAELKNTLDYERTEGKKKVYAMADARRSHTGELTNTVETPGRETTPGREITPGREMTEADLQEKCDSVAAQLTKIAETPNMPASEKAERKQTVTPVDSKRKPRWALKGKTSVTLVPSSASTSTLVSATARSPTTRARTLNPATTNTKKGSTIISKKPPSLPSVLNKKINHGRGLSSKYTSMHHADREAQRLKYETHLEEIKLAKLKKFQLNREIRHVENEILQWTANSSDEISTGARQFDSSSLHQSQQQRNNPTETNEGISETAVNAVASSSSESNFGQTSTNSNKRPVDRLRKRSRALLSKTKPIGYSGSSNRPRSHVVHQLESNIDLHESYIDQTRSDIDQPESYIDQAGSNTDQSKFSIDQTRSDIDPTRSYFDQPGLNTDQSKFSIDQTRSDIDPTRSYFDQPGLNTDQSKFSIDQTRSDIDPTISYFDQPGLFTDQSKFSIDQTRSDIDPTRSYFDQPGLNTDQSKFSIDQTRSDIDPTRSYFDQPGLNTDQSKFTIDQTRSDIDPTRSYFDQPGSYIDKPGSNVNHPRSYIDQPGSYIDQPRSNILQPGSNVDHLGSYSDWSGSFLGRREDVEGDEGIMGGRGGGGGYVGNDHYSADIHPVPGKFGFTNFAFDRNTRDED